MDMRVVPKTLLDNDICGEIFFIELLDRKSVV